MISRGRQLFWAILFFALFMDLVSIADRFGG